MTVKELKKKVNAKTNNMARKAKGSGFKMKSGNTTSFKMMGSSPTKYTNPATGGSLNPYAPDVIQNMQGMGVSGDVMEEIIKNKTKKEEEQIESGQKIDTKDQIENNVSKVEDIKKVKPKKTKFQEKWEKKHSTGDYKRGGSKERERMQKGESEFQYKNRIKKMNKGLKDLRGTTDKDPVDLTNKTGPKEASSGGADFTDVSTKFTPPETSELSFSDAFADARKKFGPGKEFDYKGKKYTTDRADDKKVKKTNKEIDESINNYLNEDSTVVVQQILTDEFNNPVETVEEELKNKGFNYGDNKFDYSSPVEKKSPYKKGIGKYAKKAKGKRGYKMKRKK